MPISQFGAGIRNFVMFIPGTYGVVLFRNYYMNGVLDEFSNSIPADVMEGIRDSFDANVYLFGNKIEIYQMYLVLIISIIALAGIYLALVLMKKNKKEG